jgi:hypothetical protein
MIDHSLAVVYDVVAAQLYLALGSSLQDFQRFGVHC